MIHSLNQPKSPVIREDGNSDSYSSRNFLRRRKDSDMTVSTKRMSLHENKTHQRNSAIQFQRAQTFGSDCKNFCSTITGLSSVPGYTTSSFVDL